MDPQRIFFVVVLMLFVFLIWKYSWKIQLMYNSVGTSMYTPESFTTVPGREAQRALKRSFVEGKKIASQKGIIFAGLLRDSAEALPAIRKKVERIGSKFRDYKVLLVENNSVDGTRDMLLRWARENPRVTVLGCGVNAKQCAITQGAAAKATEGHSVYRSRIEKMVNLRNIYLEYIQSDPEFDTTRYDYTAVWDLDTIGVTYLDGIFDTIYKLSQPRSEALSAVCAHGIYRWLGVLPLYYDTYAHLDYGDDFHIDNKLQHDIRKGIATGIGHKRGQPLVPVKSCFSGFTIYRTSDLMSSQVKYTMTPLSEKNLECEHVRLNSSLPGEVAMNPSMINLVLLNK